MSIREAIVKSLPIAQNFLQRYHEPVCIRTRENNGGWSIRWENRPSIRNALGAADRHLQDIGRELNSQLLLKYPDYRDGVGVRGLGRFNFSCQDTWLLARLITRIWEKNNTLTIDKPKVDEVVEEFAQFMDSAVIRVCYRAQLLGFKMECDSLELRQDLVVRRLSNEEFSKLCSEPWSGMDTFHNEFILEGDRCEPKSFSSPENEPVLSELVRNEVDKVLVALRTLKAGRVGVYWISFLPRDFCPLPLSSVGFAEMAVSHGYYCLSNDDLPKLKEHARRLFALSEPALELACRRLAHAETRFRFDDQIVDAVIGMEALLLSGLSADDRRGELKFRFSLNYSTLFSTPEERQRAFCLAKSLYDLRSVIAHGARIGSDFRVCEEKLPLPKVAEVARETLRGLVCRFLSVSQTHPYKKREFWERKYFGFPNSDANS